MQIFNARGDRDGDRLRIHASGELDLATAPRLEACVRTHRRADTTMVQVDLREVQFIDSTGVRVLLTLQTQAQRDGWTLVILPSDAVLRLISLLGLQRQLLAPQLHAVEQASPISATG